jgi:hypothetical protein
MRINDDVANVLANSRVEGNKLFLPEGQLDRKLYVAVNKVLTAIKGKWTRGVKAHVFSEDPSEVIENILLTGEYVSEKSEFQIFETPDILADELVDMAEIKEGEITCEPSAGRARIAQYMPGCRCIELNRSNRELLISEGYDVVGEDFLDYHEPVDVIVANPPFTKQQDIDHVNHMLDIAKRRVVSVMSASVLYRDNKKTTDFRERVESLGGVFTVLPDKTFAESGTMVKTCVVCVDV